VRRNVCCAEGLGHVDSRWLCGFASLWGVSLTKLASQGGVGFLYTVVWEGSNCIGQFNPDEAQVQVLGRVEDNESHAPMMTIVKLPRLVVSQKWSAAIGQAKYKVGTTDWSKHMTEKI
jgi:hypothetical protein